MRLPSRAYIFAALSRVQWPYVSLTLGLSLAVVLAIILREPATSGPAVAPPHAGAKAPAAYRAPAEALSVIYIANDQQAVEDAQSTLREEASLWDSGSMAGFEAFWSATVLLTRTAEEEVMVNDLMDKVMAANFPAPRLLVFDLRPGREGFSSR
jgi:hypothetical protein